MRDMSRTATLYPLSLVEPCSPDASVDYINQTVAENAARTGQSNAYQAVAQTAAQVVQDARASLQNTSMMSSSVEAVADKLIAQFLAAADIPSATEVMMFLEMYSGPTGPVAMKEQSLARIEAIAAKMMTDFPTVGAGSRGSEKKAPQKKTPQPLRKK
jgi:hypothetical protein